jgi:hypothetical protein
MWSPGHFLDCRIRLPLTASFRLADAQVLAGKRSRGVPVSRWCAAEGRGLAGPRWEIYGDWHDDPAELRTEVYYLLR